MRRLTPVFLENDCGPNFQQLNEERGRRQQQQEQAEMEMEETADERTNAALL